MISDRQAPVVIVGGGFSGTIVAAQLARRGTKSVLIEGTGRAGLGIAYSTGEPAHVLNVRAESMSAWADEPTHFAEAFAQHGGTQRGFAERRLFGRYVQSILREAVGRGRVTLIERKALAAEPSEDGWAVRLEGGETVHAEALVLAMGNQPPEPLPFVPHESPRVVNNPWDLQSADAIAELAETGRGALIVGTGLTMIDTVLSLDAAGHRGPITALSRRGLIPRAHADFEPAPVDKAEVPQGSAKDLWGWLRRRGAQVGWRAAVDSLRPHSHALWQSLDEAQQRQFLRHARPWWDVHRHRIAPEVAQRIHELVAAGQLQVIAGRVRNVSSTDNGLEIRISLRGAAGEMRVAVDYIFNCTGPLGTISRTRDPMVRQMLEEQLVSPDRLRIGLDVDERSRVSGGPPLWAMGPLTKGKFWEIVAVPDIRVQAAQIADDIARELDR